jgi:pimeloyl-ACP methyl ester carboxylesterase
MVTAVSRTISVLPAEVREQYPYVSRFLTVNGLRMHYVDEGPRGAPPVLLLHGNPSWGFLWRRTIPPLLAAGLRVVVPDMIGMGLSERPADPRALTLDNHTANLVALLDRLDLRRVTFVCHDWGGPTGIGAMLTRPARAAAVAVMSTWSWTSPAAPFHQQPAPWRMLHAPLLGPLLVGRLGAMPGRAMYLSVTDRNRFRDSGQAGFAAVAETPADRAAMWTWPRHIPIGRPDGPVDGRFAWLEDGVRRLELPATVIWGRQDDVFPADTFAATWQQMWPHAEGVHLVEGRHFLQEDSGAEIGALLADFVTRVARDAR